MCTHMLPATGVVNCRVKSCLVQILVPDGVYSEAKGNGTVPMVQCHACGEMTRVPSNKVKEFLGHTGACLSKSAVQLKSDVSKIGDDPLVCMCVCV